MWRVGILLVSAQATGAELLWRVSDSFALPVDERLADGAYLSHLNGRRRGERLTVRVVEYTVTTTHTRADGEEEQTSELFCLITTLLEPQAAPALELAELYACRWTAGAPPPCAPTAPPWLSRNCGPCSVSTRLCVNPSAKPPVNTASRPTTSASNRSSTPPGDPSARPFPPGQLRRKIRDVQADLAREAVRPRPGRSAPRATKRSTPGYRTLRPDEPPTSRVTHDIHIHRLDPEEEINAELQKAA